MRWIHEQIESIRTQRGVEIAILASDDGSIDGTDRYLRATKGVRLLAERGPYGSAGQNFFRLLSRADFTGHDFVAFSDQDDIWYPGKLSRAIDCLERERCECYSANVAAFWDDGREALVKKSYPQKEFDYLFEGSGPGCTYVMHTRVGKQFQDLLRAAPRVTENIAVHDWFLYAWARSRRLRWFIDKEPVMHYRQHAANELGVNVGARAAIIRIGLIKSGWYRKHVEAIAKACGLDSNVLVQNVLRKTLSGRIRLALHAGKFRRRRRDAIFLGFASLMGWF